MENQISNQDYYMEVKEVNKEKDDKNDVDDDLKKLLEQNVQIKKSLKKELDEYLEDVRINLNIFATWCRSSLNDATFYNTFRDNFDEKFRSQLFLNIFDFFYKDELVTTDILFYWKFMVINLLHNSKKYRSSLDELKLDKTNHNTNLRFVKERNVFKCFINDEPICYFKENGSDYYVS